MEATHLIATGRTAEIYAWGQDQVLKLFYPRVGRRAVEYEQRMAQTVVAAGVKTPAVGEIVEVNGRLGLVYQRVEATSMLNAIMRKPWLVKGLASQFADLQAAIHACAAPGLPPMRQRLEERIRNARPLPEHLRQAILEVLATLPEGKVICHGDFHPDNILMTAQGPMVIDWIDATSGHPLGDVARTALLTVYGTLPPGRPLAVLLSWMRGNFYRAYTQRYFSLSSYSSDQVQAWLPVIAAARLDEGINEEEHNLLRIVQQGLTVAGNS